MIAKKIKKFTEVRSYRSMTPEQLAPLRNERLRAMVHHAYTTTDLYKELMDKVGIKPLDIQTVEDLRHLPTITKSDVQERYSEAISRQFSEEECRVRSTSGSSGKMLRVLWEPESFWNRICMYYRCLSMIGYTPFKKLLYFLPTPEKTGFTFGLFRQKGLELGLPFHEIRKELLTFKPDIMAIYPSYAVDLGRSLSRDDVRKIGIKAISLNSEVILPHERAEIERLFNCPTYDEYSSVEMGFIASMCSNHRMHLFTDNVILEILDDQGNPAKVGERGEIVVTSLTNFAMPFLRYRIGDYSHFIGDQECPCGSTFPAIGPIEGRKDDSFTLANGTVVPAWQIYEAVERPLEEFGMDKMVLSDFFLVQKKFDQAEFFYVKGPDYQEEYLSQLQEGIDDLFDSNLHITIQETDDIDRIKTVKRKYIHCDLAV